MSTTSLAHSILNEGADRYWMFLHGILGSRSNWRSIARRLLADLNKTNANTSGAVLVDLRCHGESQEVAPPHTIAEAADDVARLCVSLDRPVEVVLGHSFGGKVALALADEPPPALKTLWIVDSQPGPGTPGEANTATGEVFRILRTLPTTFASREDFVAKVVEQGQEKGIAQWLAMNLVAPAAADGDWNMPLDLDALDALMASYDDTDLWPLVAQVTSPQLHLVAGGTSPVLSDADLSRFQNSPGANVHVIPDAGHWVHADAPRELLALLTQHHGG